MTALIAMRQRVLASATIAALAVGLLLSLVRAELSLEIGKEVFSNNCASCHAGGGNVVMAAKNLRLDTLEKYSMDSVQAITDQVRKGKNAMPSFLGRLNDDQIDAVASYVLDRAKTGW